MEETLRPPHCLEKGDTELRPYLDSEHSWKPREEKNDHPVFIQTTGTQQLVK